MKTVSDAIKDVERGGHTDEDLTNNDVRALTWLKLSAIVSRRGSGSGNILREIDGIAAAGAPHSDLRIEPR